MKRLFLSLLLTLFLCVWTFAENDPLDFGNPSNATTNTSNQFNFLVEHGSFTLSYNKARGAANWVAWHLDSSDLGSLERPEPGPFAADTLLPEALRIPSTGYEGSGFDRGHMCPSGDRTVDDAINAETFVMSNMQPQRPRLNRNTWKNLEEFEREMVGQGNEAYIFAGCFGGTTKIHGKVIRPTRCWKIILVLPEGSDDLHRVTAQSKVIVVSMPNTTTLSTNWKKFVSTINAIEEATEFDFFSKLPNSIENALEAKASATS